MRNWVLAGLLLVLSNGAMKAADLTAEVSTSEDAVAKAGAPAWQFTKVDPKTKRKLVYLTARRSSPTRNRGVLRLEGVKGQIYRPGRGGYANVNFETAFLDERTGALFTGHDVSMVQLP